MDNKLIVKPESIASKIKSIFQRPKTPLQNNTELWEFLKERYTEPKKVMGIFYKEEFGTKQLDQIVSLDISRESYISSLDGIDELTNLRELSCRLGPRFDYDSICRALSGEKLEKRKLTIESIEQLEGCDIDRLPSDLKIEGPYNYEYTKKYDIEDGKIVEKPSVADIKRAKREEKNQQVIDENESMKPQKKVDIYGRELPDTKEGIWSDADLGSDTEDLNRGLARLKYFNGREHRTNMSEEADLVMQKLEKGEDISLEEEMLLYTKDGEQAREFAKTKEILERKERGEMTEEDISWIVNKTFGKKTDKKEQLHDETFSNNVGDNNLRREDKKTWEIDPKVKAEIQKAQVEIGKKYSEKATTLEINLQQSNENIPVPNAQASIPAVSMEDMGEMSR